jgi:5,5'-dehydrodivanillate O-demethylase
METAEVNQRLTRVGAGTPMGELLRRYWQPFLALSQLDENPVRPVRLLGEDLVCFKDRSGSLGLIGRRCAHRLVDLQFGIPEAHGLRCPYHGWCYDEAGNCTETPLEPKSSRLKSQVHLAGYPVEEMGGLLWAYLGPSPAPLLPRWDVFVWPNALRQVGFSVIGCNWLQCQENAADPAHNPYLHGDYFKYVLEREGRWEQRSRAVGTHRAISSMRSGVGVSKVIAEPAEYGLKKALVYEVEEGAERDSVVWFPFVVFPYFTRVTGGGVRTEVQLRIPIDDTSTLHINYGLYAAPPGIDVPTQASIPAYEVPLTDESGKPVLDFVLGQDMAMWQAQGEINDRTRETLASTDVAVRLMRDQFLEQMAIVEAGGEPINVFRDASAMGETIHLELRLDSGWDELDQVTGSSRSNYHRGHAIDDADRYGPALPEVIALMERVEAHYARQPIQAG